MFYLSLSIQLIGAVTGSGLVGKNLLSTTVLVYIIDAYDATSSPGQVNTAPGTAHPQEHLTTKRGTRATAETKVQ